MYNKVISNIKMKNFSRESKSPIRISDRISNKSKIKLKSSRSSRKSIDEKKFDKLNLKINSVALDIKKIENIL